MTQLPPPLDGVRVIDVTSYIAGSYAATMLADLGADVVKVESLEGDSFRELPGFFAWNRGKRSIALNLKTPDGRAVVERLARDADVVMENMRPGVADRLGVGEATLRAINPRLIYCSTTAFGSTGPYVDRPGFDPLLQGLAGIMALQGFCASRSSTTTRRRSRPRRCWRRCSCASGPASDRRSRPRCSTR
jgi:CoA:oxalate CoA-transferase